MVTFNILMKILYGKNYSMDTPRPEFLQRAPK
jgi:hypothetical protein